MSGSSTSGSASDTLRREQTRRWRSGDFTSIETLLSNQLSTTLSELSELKLDLIYGEVLLREEKGERPVVDDYLVRFPELDDAIRRLFDVHQIFAELDPAEIGSENFDASTGTAPSSLSDYDLLEPIGRGGTGVVYRALHRRLDRIVALKLLGDSENAASSSLDRFRTEAAVIAQLRHPQIVQVYDYGELNGQPFLSLEYVPGGSLESWTKPPLRAVSEAVQLTYLVARGMAYSHRQGVIHRDLKPANILLAPAGDEFGDAFAETLDTSASCNMSPRWLPKITDFGLAKRFTDDSHLTQTHTILGTAAYMAPEQAWGKTREIGPAADIHAIGVILFELLTGTNPYRADSMIETLDRVRFHIAAKPSTLRREIPIEMDLVCARCLAKDPNDRYETADLLADDLRKYLMFEPLAGLPTSSAATIRQRRAIWTKPLVASLVLIFVVGVFSWKSWLSPLVTPEYGDQVAIPIAERQRDTPETFAFLVGVRSYQFSDSALELEYTEADVDELARLLQKHGVPRKNIQLLTQWSEGDNPALAPSAHNIQLRLREMLSRTLPQDTVVVALTGMGGEAGADRRYAYLPSGASVDRPESLMTLASLYDMLGSSPAKCKLLMVDTCQSVLLTQLETPVASVPAGTAALFACSSGEASYESSELRHGVFSHFVLRALEGAADSNGDSAVSLDELSAFARRQVANHVAVHFDGATQTPTIETALPGDTVILKKP